MVPGKAEPHVAVWAPFIQLNCITSPTTAFTVLGVKEKLATLIGITAAFVLKMPENKKIGVINFFMIAAFGEIIELKLT